MTYDERKRKLDPAALAKPHIELESALLAARRHTPFPTSSAIIAHNRQIADLEARVAALRRPKLALETGMAAGPVIPVQREYGESQR